MDFDLVVVGAGVIGLAIAYKTSQQGKSVLLIEKQSSFGSGISSRNSEVIHAGIYYPENSLKATLCLEGRNELYAFCQKYRVPYKRIGKLIIATDERETVQLEQILKQGKQNGVNDLEILDQLQIRHLEPLIQAQAALLSPSTGIIDSHSFMQTLLGLLQHHNGIFVANTEPTQIIPLQHGFHIKGHSSGDDFQLTCRQLVNAAGLSALQLARKIVGICDKNLPRLYPCKGHYFALQGTSPFSHLIYPVPNAHLIGLGIHATLDLAGQVKFGPDSQYIDNIDYTVPEHLATSFAQAIKRYFPSLAPNKLTPAYSGIRPKLQGPKDAFSDFVFEDHNMHGIPGLINMFGIESPGLTASLAIARHITQQLESDASRF